MCSHRYSIYLIVIRYITSKSDIFYIELRFIISDHDISYRDSRYVISEYDGFHVNLEIKPMGKYPYANRSPRYE